MAVFGHKLYISAKHTLQGLHALLGVQSLLLWNCGYVAVIHGDGTSVAGGEEGRNFISTFCVYYNDMMQKKWDLEYFGGKHLGILE